MENLIFLLRIQEVAKPLLKKFREMIDVLKVDLNLRGSVDNSSSTS
jgi:hypothetical protein